jgi:hypothetical protein
VLNLERQGNLYMWNRSGITNSPSPWGAPRPRLSQAPHTALASQVHPHSSKRSKGWGDSGFADGDSGVRLRTSPAS